MRPFSPSIRVVLLAALAGCAQLLGCSSSSSAGGQGENPPDARAETGGDAASAVETGGGGDDASVEGQPCTSAADCPSANVCAYPTAEGCSATGVCIGDSFIGACACGYNGPGVCDCNGQPRTPSCCYPQGYSPFPISPSTSCLQDAGRDGAPEGGADASGE